MQESIIKIFPKHLRDVLNACQVNGDCLEEIRLRIRQPLLFFYGNEEWFLDTERKMLTKRKEQAYVVTKEDLEQMFSYLSHYSFYAYEDEIRQGYLTLEGGHRVGLAGRAVMENEPVKSMRYIYFMNIRVAKEKKDCAKKIIPYILHQDSIYNTLLVSPPGVGKTTYLRDTVRLLSNGGNLMEGLRVSVIDERSEIAACHLGMPQNDVGIRTDVLDGCDKAKGMLMVLRSMSPQVIAVDELGGEEDYRAVEKVLYSGSHILGTIHAKNMEELEQKPYFGHWLKTHIFERFVLLKKSEGGTHYFEIYDKDFKQLC